MSPDPFMRYPSMTAIPIIETQASQMQDEYSGRPVAARNETVSYVEVDASGSAESRAHLGDPGDDPGAAAPEADCAMADASNPGGPPGSRSNSSSSRTASTSSTSSTST